MIDEARAEADRIRVDAQAHAEEARQEGNELLERAKQEADRVLVGLSARRENVGPAASGHADLGSLASPRSWRWRSTIRARRRSPPRPNHAVAEAPSQSPPAQAVEEPTPSSADSETERQERAVEGHVSDQSDTVDSLEGMLSDDGLDLPDMQSLALDFDDDSDDDTDAE